MTSSNFVTCDLMARLESSALLRWSCATRALESAANPAKLKYFRGEECKTILLANLRKTEIAKSYNKVIQKEAVLPSIHDQAYPTKSYLQKVVFSPSLTLSTLLILSHLMIVLSNAHPWCFFKALCTEGLRLWTFTWACSCPPCFTRPLRNSRSASSCPPGAWRSLALMPRQRWVMVRCFQSFFRVGRGSASLVWLACVNGAISKV